MSEINNTYQKYVAEVENDLTKKQILKTVYLSRRSIWVNVVLCFFLSFLAGYIHTRRWKTMAVFCLSLFIFMLAISSENQSFEESFAQGQSFAPLVSLIATIDNSLAISKARKKVNNSQV